MSKIETIKNAQEQKIRNMIKLRNVGAQTQKKCGLCLKGGGPNIGGPDLEKVRAPRVGDRRVGPKGGGTQRGGPAKGVAPKVGAVV